MGRYASETTVPVEKSRAEIESVLVKYGARAFSSGWSDGQATIAFQVGDDKRGLLFIRFVLPLPKPTEERFIWKVDRYGYKSKRTEQQAKREHDQDVRQRWRALVLTVKAKLEAVEIGISTLEQEFMAFIVLPNQLTLGEWVASHALEAIRHGKMPPAICGPKQDAAGDEVIDAEIVKKE